MRVPTLQRCLVITGTGTDVGKTYLTAGLLRGALARGHRCLGLKPIETGYTASTSDAQALATAAQHARIEPYFTAADPVSPHRAALHVNIELRAEVLADWVRQQAAPAPTRAPVVETAGGLFTPISLRETNLDLVVALEPCLFVLVAEDRLGVLHDVGAAVRAAAAQHRAPDVVLLNRRDPSAARLDNARELEALGLGPQVQSSGDSTTVDTLLARAFGTPTT